MWLLTALAHGLWICGRDVLKGPSRQSRDHLASVEIGCKRRRALSARQSDIPVGPNKVDGVPPQTGLIDSAMPRKDVQRQLSRVTRRTNLRVSLSVDVSLPVQRGQRREIVHLDAVHNRPRPRKAVAAMNRASPPLAQAASAIVHRRLRD